MGNPTTLCILALGFSILLALSSLEFSRERFANLPPSNNIRQTDWRWFMFIIPVGIILGSMLYAGQSPDYAPRVTAVRSAPKSAFKSARKSTRFAPDIEAPDLFTPFPQRE